MAFNEETLQFTQLQAVEVTRLIQESADLELANRMQLAEAIAISSAMALASSSLSSSLTTDTSQTENDGEGYGLGELFGKDDHANALVDRDAALVEQQLEAEMLNQELADEAEALREQSRLVEIDAICEHDGKFARFLSTLSESEWEARGTELDDPFTFTSEDVSKAIAAALPRISNDSLKRKAPTRLEGLLTSLDRGKDIWEPGLAAASLLDVGDGSTDMSYLATITHAQSFQSGLPCGLNVVEKDSTRDICKICYSTEITLFNSHVTSEKCSHRFCVECLRTFAETTVKSAKSYIPCPHYNCEELWSAEMCDLFLSPSMLSIMTLRQIEEAFPERERVYCPYKDCSFLQLKPATVTQPSTSYHPHQTAIGGVECFSCNRYFCFECKVPWHGDLTCEEWKSLPEDEKSPHDVALLKSLAKSKKWQRCSCGFVVEQNGGCNHISCRCGKHFCYVCGGDWQHNHICAW